MVAVFCWNAKFAWNAWYVIRSIETKRKQLRHAAQRIHMGDYVCDVPMKSSSSYEPHVSTKKNHKFRFVCYALIHFFGIWILLDFFRLFSCWRAIVNNESKCYHSSRVSLWPHISHMWEYFHRERYFQFSTIPSNHRVVPLSVRNVVVDDLTVVNCSFTMRLLLARLSPRFIR